MHCIVTFLDINTVKIVQIEIKHILENFSCLTAKKDMETSLVTVQCVVSA